MQIESHNPYAEAEVTATVVGSARIDPIHAGMVQQVKIIGILLIAQGILEIVQGGIMVALSFFIEGIFSLPGAEAGPAPPQSTIDFLQGIYLALGVFSFGAAILRLIAAFGCFWFRGRTWIIVTLFVGLVSAFSGLCGITSIGLCIYGLIVMLNPGVAKAFELVREGSSPGEVQQLNRS